MAGKERVTLPAELCDQKPLEPSWTRRGECRDVCSVFIGEVL